MATTVQMPSFTDPNTTYSTSATSCTCKAFEFGTMRDPEYRCKHQRQLLADVAAYRASRTPRCSYCGTEQVVVAGAMCPGCSSFIALMADQYAGEQVAPVATDWPSTALCCHCSRRYNWTDASPLYCSRECAHAARVAA